MKIEHYLAKEFWKWFVVGLCLFGMLSLVIEFFEKLDDIIDHKASFFLSASYFLYKTLLFIFQLAPLAVLLATLVTLTLLARSGELLALLSCGISPRHIAYPFLLAACSISLLELAAHEYLLPTVQERADTLLKVDIKKERPAGAIQRDQLWFRSRDNYIWRIDLYYPREAVIEGITLFKLNEQQRIEARIDARRVRWQKEAWHFYQGVLRQFQGEKIYSEAFTQRIFPLVTQPLELNQIAKDPEKMSISELYAYLRRLRERKFDETIYLTDFHEKLAFPFVSCVMALVGLALSLHPQQGRKVAWGIGLTLGIGFLYWALFSLGLSLGKSGRLHPLVAAWGANLFFSFLALWRIIR